MNLPQTLGHSFLGVFVVRREAIRRICRGLAFLRRPSDWFGTAERFEVEDIRAPIVGARKPLLRF